jgi:hypothetical protein
MYQIRYMGSKGISNIDRPYFGRSRHRFTTFHASSLKEAASLLECHGLGASDRLPSILRNLDKLGLNSLSGDDFYEKMLEYASGRVLISRFPSIHPGDVRIVLRSTKR